jgi:(2Fe-2S) ferredoxin
VTSAGKEETDGAPRRFTVRICIGPTCGDSRGGRALVTALTARIEQGNLADRVQLVEEACLGHCLRGPNILVAADESRGPDNQAQITTRRADPASLALYSRVTPADLDRIVDRHLSGGIVVRGLLHRPPVRNS